MTSAKRTDGIATMERLRDAAVQELSRNGVEKFNLEDVLQRADAARSSLYHHFGNKSGLIEAAQLAHLKLTLTEDNASLRKVVETVSSPQELVDVVLLWLKEMGKKPALHLRRQRISTLAAAEHNSEIASALRRNQVSGTTYFAETLEIAKKRGLINPQLEIRALAYWIQGQFVGRALLDVSKETDLDDAWAEATLASLVAVLGVPVK